MDTTSRPAGEAPTGEALTIRLEIDIAAPPERVWAILGSTEGMKRLFSTLDDFEPRLGGRLLWHYAAAGEPQYRMWGEVVRFTPPRELAFTWIEQESGRDPWPAPTLVTFMLEPTPTGTHVTLIHSGFEALPGERARRAFEGYLRGWKEEGDLERLKQLAEEGTAA